MVRVTQVCCKSTIYPDEKKDWKLIDRHPDRPARQRAFDIIKKLAEMDFVKHGAVKEPDERFPYFHFDEIAQELFYNWLEKLELKTLRVDDHPILIEHLSKYRSLVPSLALIFHLIEIADGREMREISMNSVLDAISWCTYLESHARRIYGMATNVSHQSAARLAQKIEKGELGLRFSTRDVLIKGWSLLDSKELILNACDELVEAGWLRQEACAEKVGRPKSPVFAINPKLNVKKVVAENSS